VIDPLAIYGTSIDPAAVYGQHPARCLAFGDLVRVLEGARERRHVTSVRDGDLELWTYTAQCAYDQAWSVASLIARGLIIDHGRQQVVATPFPKFFNHGEWGWPLPKEAFEVTEKLDGSLGILFMHQGEWRVATKGAFRSPQAQWATAWLKANVATSLLDGIDPDTTYLVEIIYAENRIVVSYGYQGLVMLTAYDGDGNEVPRPEVERYASYLGLNAVRRFEYATFEELVGVAKALRLDQEGFVVRFESGLRIKLKGDEYCRIHRLISNCTPLAVWDALVAGDSTEAIRRELPEEFHADFDNILRILLGLKAVRLAALHGAVDQVAALTDKDLGLLVQGGAHGFGDIADLIFPARKRGWDWFESDPKGRRVLLNAIRPTGNALPGYEPTSAMNRFNAEVRP
jgi:RNA ligase